MVHGHAGYRAFTEEVLRDPVIVALRQRVHVTEDPAFSAMVPRRKPARVTVTLTDGRHSVRTCESAKGDFAQPFTAAEIRAKFRELAGVLLTSTGVGAIEEALDRSTMISCCPCESTPSAGRADSHLWDGFGQGVAAVHAGDGGRRDRLCLVAASSLAFSGTAVAADADGVTHGVCRGSWG